MALKNKKAGETVWVSCAVGSNGCVLSTHMPPTEIVLTQNYDSQNPRGCLTTATFPKGRKMPKWGYYQIKMFETEEEATKSYKQQLTEIQQDLLSEIERIKGYVEKYEEYKQGKVKKPKQESEIKI